jgi:hypothetical protein
MAESTDTAWYATRLAVDWSPALQERADAAGIRVFRTWPAAKTYWREEWGKGNIFVGYPDDPAEVVLELPASSARAAEIKVIQELAVDRAQFIVSPEWCPAAGAEARARAAGLTA